jgi:hypothetical protein
VLLILKMKILLQLAFQVPMNGAEEVLGTSATNNYRTLIVHRALSATVGEDDKRQLHNLFSTCFLSSRTAVCIQSLTEVAATIW